MKYIENYTDSIATTWYWKLRSTGILALGVRFFKVKYLLFLVILRRLLRHKLKFFFPAEFENNWLDFCPELKALFDLIYFFLLDNWEGQIAGELFKTIGRLAVKIRCKWFTQIMEWLWKDFFGPETTKIYISWKKGKKGMRVSLHWLLRS